MQMTQTLILPFEKACTLCGKTKAMQEFAKRSTSKDVHHPWCKPCKKEYLKKYSKNWRQTKRGKESRSPCKSTESLRRVGRHKKNTDNLREGEKLPTKHYINIKILKRASRKAGNTESLRRASNPTEEPKKST